MPQFKKCNSCKELLSYNQFGELNSSPDKYNPTCKCCKNYIRRKSYQKNKDSDEETIQRIPLRVHNYNHLVNLINENEIMSVELNAQDVNSHTNYKIKIEKDEQAYSQSIKQEDNLIKGVYFPVGVRIDYFFDYLQESLFEQSIKIID